MKTLITQTLPAFMLGGIMGFACFSGCSQTLSNICSFAAMAGVAALGWFAPKA